MAIKHKYTTKHGVQLDNAYTNINIIGMGRDHIGYIASTYANEESRNSNNEILENNIYTVQVDTTQQINIWGECYEQLKSISCFIGAVDC